MPQFSAAEIRRYYDRHTASFVALGQGGAVGAIHRAVWGPGVRSRDDAFRYVENRIADLLRDLVHDEAGSDESRAPFIVDLGCGVGASLCHLARQIPNLSGAGITLSPVQARLAGERIRDAALAERLACIEGDYCDVPRNLRRADLVYAIESFAHGSDPKRFFVQCHALLRPNGLLAICDDFLRPSAPATASDEAREMVERFRRGWRINTLLDSSGLQAMARDAGFVHESTTDLSHHLELDRPRDRAARALVGLLHWLPIGLSQFDYLIGGDALQRCLRRGWVGYDLAVFRRTVD